MKKIDKGKLFFIFLLMIIAIIFALISMTYEPNARLIPLAVSCAALIMGVPVIVNEIYPLKMLSCLNFELSDFAKNGPHADNAKDTGSINLIPVLLWIFGFFIVIFLLGFHIGIFFFALLYLRIQGQVKWFRAILIAGVLWGFIFTVFVVGMKLSLFRGVLFGEILPLV